LCNKNDLTYKRSEVWQFASHFVTIRRRKYDSAKTLEVFSVTLRSEVDLGQLREHLIMVVQETMQPAHVSLWLRQSEHNGKHQDAWGPISLLIHMKDEAMKGNSYDRNKAALRCFAGILFSKGLARLATRSFASLRMQGWT
jgi:hypothetical protein